MARSFIDRFGNEAANVVCIDKKGNGFYRGYIEINKPGLYKLEPSDETEGKRGDTVKYVRVTRMQAQRRGSGAFGGRRGGGF